MSRPTPRGARETRRPGVGVLIGLSILMPACSGPRETPPAPAPAAPELTVAQWRAKHDVDYRRDYVSIAGMHDLRPGVNTAGSAARHDIVLPSSTPADVGRFVRDGDRVRFEPSPGVDVRLGGRQVTAPVDLRDDRTVDRDELLIGEVRLVVHASGDSLMLRVRDPHGELARNFLGFDWFPEDPAYRVVGRFTPDPSSHTIRVPNTFGDIDEFASEGIVEFTLQGQALTLRPFTTRPGRLYFVFRDASSGQETYKAARFLYSDLRPDGTTVLDFNIAYNPPCAFNPYTTCPLPLAENRLPVKILAGEKKYPVDVALPTRN